MAITIRVGNKANRKLVTLEMDVRKSLSGDLMIFDHGDIDIVLSTAKNKVTAFPKEVMNDLVYGAQNRLFTFLRKKGVIVPESVQAGNVYGSMEAVILESVDENLSSSKIALLNISKFIDDERPYFEFVDSIVDEFEDDMTDPENIDSTDLGDVEHSVEKGSIRKGYVRDPYSLSYLYTI